LGAEGEFRRKKGGIQDVEKERRGQASKQDANRIATGRKHVCLQRNRSKKGRIMTKGDTKQSGRREKVHHNKFIKERTLSKMGNGVKKKRNAKPGRRRGKTYRGGLPALESLGQVTKAFKKEKGGGRGQGNLNQGETRSYDSGGKAPGKFRGTDKRRLHQGGSSISYSATLK